MSRTRLHRAVCAALLALALPGAACGTTPSTEGADPALVYLEHVRARIVAAREQPSYTLRFNPTACDCPPYEIALGGVWHRVVFAGAEPDDETIVALEAAVAASRAGSGPATWEVQGSLDDVLSTCGRGTLVVPLVPSAFGAPPAETPEVP